MSSTAAVMGVLGVIVISGIAPAADTLAATAAVGLALVALAQRVKVYGPSTQPQDRPPGSGDSGLARQ